MNIDFYASLNKSGVVSEAEAQILHDDYKTLVDIFAFIIQSLKDSGKKTTDNQNYAEILAIKFIYHSLNLIRLFEKSLVQFNRLDIKLPICDVSSSYVMTRVNIENYLTFYYLFGVNLDNNTQELKWLQFKISGLNRRVNKWWEAIIKRYKGNLPEKMQKQYMIDKDNLDKALKEIQLHPESKVKRNKLDYFLDAKLKSWSSLLIDSNLKHELFLTSWELYSNHAHSEYISLIQVSDYLGKFSDAKDAQNTTLILNLMLTAIYIREFCSLFSCAEERYRLLTDLERNVINYLDNVARKDSSFSKDYISGKLNNLDESTI
jgi:hypothetical protein